MIKAASSRQRGSRDLWLNAAYELLITGGIDAVKVMPLAKSLNLTRTGFYWYFQDLAELHGAMIQRWASRNTEHLVARCETDAANICEALFNLMDCWLDPRLFDARLDLAIRNWARVAPMLQAQVSEADTRRIDAVTDLFRRFDFSDEQAQVRGMTVIYTQIGYISMEITEDHEERLRRVRHYVELFAGVRPQDCDVDSFVSRQRLVECNQSR